MTDIERQMSIIRDERMMLRDRLEQMQPVGWDYDLGMNEIPRWSARQLKEMDRIGRRMKELAEADRALGRA